MAFQRALELANTSKALTKEKKRHFQSGIEKKIAKNNAELVRVHEAKETDITKQEQLEDNPKALSVSKVNPQFPAAHAAIEVRYQQGRGR